MATDTSDSDVLKPDFGARRKHFIFTDEHDALRESPAVAAAALEGGAR